MGEKCLASRLGHVRFWVGREWGYRCDLLVCVAVTTPNRSGPQLYTVNRHALAFGTLVTDLLTLEFLLRLFLYETRSRLEISFVREQNLSGLRVGKVLPENAVTDYDSLGKLIRRFNVTAAK